MGQESSLGLTLWPGALAVVALGLGSSGWAPAPRLLEPSHTQLLCMGSSLPTLSHVPWDWRSVSILLLKTNPKL